MNLAQMRAYIQRRCVKQGECMLWDNNVESGGVPRIRVKDQAGKYVTKNARRELLIAKGVDVAGKFATTTCDNPLCMAEKHAVAWTRKQLQARSSKKQTGNVALSLKRAINGRKTGKLTMDRAREMRASGLSQRKAAEVYGVSLRTAQKVLTGVSWKEYGTPFGFYAAPAANDSRRNAA